VVNALDVPCRGAYAFQVDRELARSARILLVDLHWGMGLRPLSVLVRNLRSWNPEARVIVGGITASAWPRRVLDAVGADYLIQGDAEEACPRLVRALLEERDTGGIPNLWSRDHAGPPALRRISRDAFDQVDTVTTAWFPLYDELANLFSSPFSQARHVIAARGCAYRCHTCNGSYASCFGGGVLNKSPAAIAGQVRSAAANNVEMLRFFFGRYPARRLRETLTLLAEEPAAFARGLGMYLCTPMDREMLEALRQAFPGTRITLSVPWPSEYEGRVVPREELEEMEAACVEMAGGTDAGMTTEFWACRQETLARVRERMRGISHTPLPRNYGANEDAPFPDGEEGPGKVYHAMGYTWNMARPDESAAAGDEREDERQWRRTIKLSSHAVGYQMARFLSPPLTKLFDVWGHVDDVTEDPEEVDPPQGDLAPFWAQGLENWRDVGFPLLPDIRFRALPYRRRRRRRPEVDHEGVKAELVDGGDWGVVSNTNEGVALQSRLDARSAVLAGRLPPLPADADGWVIVPSLGDAPPPESLFSDDVLALHAPEFIWGGLLTARLMTGALLFRLYPPGRSRSAGRE